MNYPIKNSINNIFEEKLAPFFDKEVLSIITIMLNRDIVPITKKAIVSDLLHFGKQYKKMNDEKVSFARLTTRDISDYKCLCQTKQEYEENGIKIVKEPLSAKTINRRLITIKSLCKLAIKEGKLKRDPSYEVRAVPLQSLAPKGITKQEWRALIKEAELQGYTRDIRDILILEMMHGAGLRASEIINIKIRDIDISERKGHVLIRNSKGGKSRKVPLNKRIRGLIEKHEANLQYFNECHPEDYLFQGQRKFDKKSNEKVRIKHRRLETPLAVNKIVEVYAKKARIKCSPHSLRHSFSYNYLAQNPGDIVGLAQILAHSNLNTTAIYTQNRLEDLQEKVEKVVD
jgi:site-specific recombinase XerD